MFPYHRKHGADRLTGTGYTNKNIEPSLSVSVRSI